MQKGERMKKAVFRIRRPYFDAIVKGEKTVEYRKWSKFWLKRLENVDIAVFICGKQKHCRKIVHVKQIPTPSFFSEQGKKDVDTASCFAIHLGEVIDDDKSV